MTSSNLHLLLLVMDLAGDIKLVTAHAIGESIDNSADILF